MKKWNEIKLLENAIINERVWMTIHWWLRHKYKNRNPSEEAATVKKDQMQEKKTKGFFVFICQLNCPNIQKHQSWNSAHTRLTAFGQKKWLFVKFYNITYTVNSYISNHKISVARLTLQYLQRIQYILTSSLLQ